MAHPRIHPLAPSSWILFISQQIIQHHINTSVVKFGNVADGWVLSYRMECNKKEVYILFAPFALIKFLTIFSEKSNFSTLKINFKLNFWIFDIKSARFSPIPHAKSVSCRGFSFFYFFTRCFPVENVRLGRIFGRKIPHVCSSVIQNLC